MKLLRGRSSRVYCKIFLELSKSKNLYFFTFLPGRQKYTIQWWKSCMIFFQNFDEKWNIYVERRILRKINEKWFIRTRVIIFGAARTRWSCSLKYTLPIQVGKYLSEKTCIIFILANFTTFIFEFQFKTKNCHNMTCSSEPD